MQGQIAGATPLSQLFMNINNCLQFDDGCRVSYLGGRTNSWIIHFLVKNIYYYVIAYKLKALYELPCNKLPNRL
jgi:hypothetical protein